MRRSEKEREGGAGLGKQTISSAVSILTLFVCLKFGRRRDEFRSNFRFLRLINRATKELSPQTRKVKADKSDLLARQNSLFPRYSNSLFSRYYTILTLRILLSHHIIYLINVKNFLIKNLIDISIQHCYLRDELLSSTIKYRAKIKSISEHRA